MATTTDSPNRQTAGRKYVDFDEFIEYQVRKTRSGIRSTDLLTAAVVLVLAVTSYLLVFLVLDHWVVPGGVGYWPRVLMLSGLVTFLVVWSVWKLALPYLRQINALFAAREIEQTQPDLKSSLLTLIDLKRAGRRVPRHILSAMEKRAATRLAETDLEQAVDRRLLMRLSYALLAVVALMCLYTVFSPKKVSTSVWRALLPTSPVTVSTRTRIEGVDPGDATVLARSQLQVTVDLAGEIPETATLLFTTKDRSFVDEPITLRDTGESLNRFRGVLAGPNGRGLLQNLTYRIVAGDAESREFLVTVKQAPYATVTEVALDYPDYMRLEDRTQPGGAIEAWEGTQVTVRAETNMPVVSGKVVCFDTEDASAPAEEFPLELVDETHLEGSWRLGFRSDGTAYQFYRVEVQTEDGAGDPKPRLYPVNIRPDLPPELQVLHPTGDVELPANGTLPVAYQAADPDFMLRYVHMLFEQTERTERDLAHQTRRPFEAPPERSSYRGLAEIRLSEFDLEPGDVLTFWLEAQDNKQPLGNTTRTPKFNIAITEPVSEEEAEQQLERQREQIAEQLQQEQDEPQDGDAAAESAEGGAESGDGQTEGSETQEGAGESEQATDGGSGTEQRPAGSQPQRTEGTSGNEQPADGQEPSADGSEPMPTPDGDQPGDESQTDASQQEAGESESGRQPPSRSDPAQDDEALQRLFEEYRDEIEREQEQSADEQPPSSDGGEQTGPQSSEGEQGDSPSGPSEPSETPTPAGGPNQPTDAADGLGQNRSDSETSESSDAGGEQRRPEDSTSDARQGDVADPAQGETSPADADGSAQEQRATGDEQGTGRPETDPNADPTPAENPLERAEGTDPATRPRGQPSDRQGDGAPQNTGGGERPEGAQPPPDTDGTRPDSPGDQGSTQDGTPEADRPPARTDRQPSGPDDSNPAPGRPEGQRSQQPSTGEQGSGQQASEGTQGGSQQGPGDATQSPGSQSDSPGQPGGQPGEQSGRGSGEGSEGTQPGGEGMSEQGGREGSESGSEGGQGGEGGEGEGSEGGGEGAGEGSGESQGAGAGQQPGDGQGGPTQGSPGPSQPSGGGGSGQAGSQAPEGSGSGGGGGSGTGPDDPNLEDKRRASELVLERLEEQLSRGETPQELLDELGWTEENLRDFMGRLDERLHDTGTDGSPEAEARRRQFETILEGLEYGSEGQQRGGGEGPREAAEGFGDQRRPVPPEFQQDQYEYRQRLSRQGRRAD